MKKMLMAMVLVAGFAGFLVLGEDVKPAGKDVKKQEQQYKEGDTGTVTGVIEKIDKGKVTVKDGEKDITVWPKWVGGAPKDGGGFDKTVMAAIEKLKVGDKVKIEWVADKEHPRIKSIAKAE